MAEPHIQQSDVPPCEMGNCGTFSGTGTLVYFEDDNGNVSETRPRAEDSVFSNTSILSAVITNYLD